MNYLTPQELAILILALPIISKIIEREQAAAQPIVVPTASDEPTRSHKDHSRTDIGDGKLRVKTKAIRKLTELYVPQLTLAEVVRIFGTDGVTAQQRQALTDNQRLRLQQPLQTSDGVRVWIKNEWDPHNFAPVLGELQRRFNFPVRVEGLTRAGRGAYNAAGVHYTDLDSPQHP